MHGDHRELHVLTHSFPTGRSSDLYDALVHRLQGDFRPRWEAMGAGLKRHLPQFRPRPSCGGTSVWLEGPKSLDTDILAREALGAGIVIEPGSAHFLSATPPRNFMRLGFSSI